MSAGRPILMKYHTLFFSKIRKYVAKSVSAAVVIGALMVNPLLFNIAATVSPRHMQSLGLLLS